MTERVLFQEIVHVVLDYRGPKLDIGWTFCGRTYCFGDDPFHAKAVFVVNAASCIPCVAEVIRAEPR